MSKMPCHISDLPPTPEDDDLAWGQGDSMSMMYCKSCDRQIDTDFDDECVFEPEFICGNCMDAVKFPDDHDPTPDEEGEPPITWSERAKEVKPR